MRPASARGVARLTEPDCSHCGVKGQYRYLHGCIPQSPITHIPRFGRGTVKWREPLYEKPTYRDLSPEMTNKARRITLTPSAVPSLVARGFRARNRGAAISLTV